MQEVPTTGAGVPTPPVTVVVEKVQPRQTRGRRTLLWLCGVTMVLALVGLALALTVALEPQGVAVNLVPVWALDSFAGLALAAALVAGLGIFALRRGRRMLLVLFVFILAFLFFFKLIVFFVLVDAFFQITSPSLYDASVAQLTSTLQGQVVNFAFTQPASWVTAQNNLGCCGYSYEEAFVLTVPVNVIQEYAGNLDQADVVALYGGKALPSYLDALHSGQSCTSAGMQEIHTLISNSPSGVYDYEAENYYEQNAVLTSPSTGYFCQSHIWNIVRPYYTYVSIEIGLLMFIEFVTIITALYLLCFVQKKRGGFADDKVEDVQDDDQDEEQI